MAKITSTRTSPVRVLSFWFLFLFLFSNPLPRPVEALGHRGLGQRHRAGVVGQAQNRFLQDPEPAAAAAAAAAKDPEAEEPKPRTTGGAACGELVAERGCKTEGATGGAGTTAPEKLMEKPDMTPVWCVEACRDTLANVTVGWSGCCGFKASSDALPTKGTCTFYKFLGNDGFQEEKGAKAASCQQ